MNQDAKIKSLRRKATAFLLSICLSAAFAPGVFAESPSDITVGTEALQTTQATQATQSTQAAQTVQPEQSSYTQTAGAGFENVESDGGTMFVGTARIPKTDGSFATVKFIYSSGINLNDKSLKLINTELNACGVTVSGSMVYVSRSDLVSDSTLVTETSERQAVFACGSEAAPTVLKAYPAYDSVETSFEYLYRGYVYSISDYTSLSSVLSGRSEITLSDDGKSAYTSIVMAEDYVEKVINGKTVKILMINSELKYCFRAPKLVYVKDDNYNVASASDIVYHYGTTTSNNLTESTQTVDELTTQSTETTSATSSEELIVSSDTESTTRQTTTNVTESSATTSSSEAQSTTDTTTINIWDYLTTASETKITAGASPIVTSVTSQNTTTTGMITVYTAATTESTTASSTVSTTSSTSTTASSSLGTTGTTTTSATLPALTTTQNSDHSAVLPNVTANESLNSGRGIVATRRLPLNVRSGPGKNYMIVTVLPKGTYVTVLDTSNPDWYMIKTMGKVVGYAYSGYIRIM